MPTSLTEWVDAAPDATQRELRQAVHTVLAAVSEMRGRGLDIVVKGGILLAVRYAGDRYTRDVDFSTTVSPRELGPRACVAALEVSLAIAVDALPYGLDCRVQSHELRPPQVDSTAPTLKIRIGYAPSANPARSARLRRLQSPTTLSVDLSYNEVIVGHEELVFRSGERILGSTLADAVGEKFRAMLQQPVRNRVRRQDAYDLYALLLQESVALQRLRGDVLRALLAKSTARGLMPMRDSLRDPAVRSRSAKEYPQLAAEIGRPLPDFDALYDAVRDYYESLPWSR